jgi:hypothetical protein
LNNILYATAEDITHFTNSCRVSNGLESTPHHLILNLMGQKRLGPSKSLDFHGDPLEMALVMAFLATQ